MGIDESLVQEIVRRILGRTTPDRIIIFGSAATGEMTSDSDIDLLIVERDPRRPAQEKRPAQRDALLAGLPLRRDRHLYRVVRGEQERHRRHRLSGEQVRQGDLRGRLRKSRRKSPGNGSPSPTRI